MMHVDDLPDGVTAKDTVTVRVTVEYLIERDRVSEVIEKGRKRARGMSGQWRQLDEDCLDAQAVSWSQRENKECSRGHVMEATRMAWVNPNAPEKTPREQWVRERLDCDPDMDCEVCIGEAERQAELRAEGY